MRCRHISHKQGVLYRLHLLYCSECRKSRLLDRQVAMGVQQLKAVEIPQEGISNTLQAVQSLERNTQAAMPLSHDLVRRKPRFWRPANRKRAVIGTCGAVLTMGLILSDREAIPNIEVPMPSMPRFNAFETHVRAGQLAKSISKELQQKAQEARQKAISIKSNAVVGTNKKGGEAANVVSNDPLSDAITSPEEAKRLGRTLYTTAQKEQLLAHYTDVLGQVRLGLKQQYWNPPVRSYTALFPYLADFRSVARGFRLESMVHEEHGEWGKALNSRLDALQFGNQIPRGGVLITELVGIAIQALGYKGVTKLVSHLSATEAKSALVRLSAIAESTFPFSSTLQEELWAAQGGMLALFQSNKWTWRAELMRMMYSGDGGEETKGHSFVKTLPLIIFSKRQIMDSMAHYYEEEMQRSAKPYGLHLAKTPIPSDPLNQMLLPVLESAYFQWTHTQMRLEMLRLLLALQAYRQENSGAYPKTLSELVSKGYLKELPKDLFAPDTQFRYAQKGSKDFLLYSVGPDGIDDNGKPATNPNLPERPAERVTDSYKYMLQDRSKGDIVVGVNVK